MEALEVLQKVDAFYRTSWEHLLVFGAIAAFVLGVAVPLLIQYYQRRLFKLEEATVTQKVSAQVEEARAALAEAHKRELTSLREEVASGLAAANKKVESALAAQREQHAKEFLGVEGGVYHVQGFLLSQLATRFQPPASSYVYGVAAESAASGAIAEAKARAEGNHPTKSGWRR